MDETAQDGSGLLARGKQFLRTAGDLAQARLELFLVELREERTRLFDAVLLAVVCATCLLMTLTLLTFALLVIFWDEHRVLVLVLLTLAYGTGAGASFWTLRRRLQHWQAFSATLDQIKKDRACLGKAS